MSKKEFLDSKMAGLNTPNSIVKYALGDYIAIGTGNYYFTEKIKEDLQEKYNVPVLPINIDTMTEKDMYNILREALYEFPVLEVKVNNQKGIGFYEKNGFKNVNVRKNYYADGSDAYLMLKEL